MGQNSGLQLWAIWEGAAADHFGILLDLDYMILLQVTHSPDLSAEAGNRQKLMQNHILSCQCENLELHWDPLTHSSVYLRFGVSPIHLLLPLKIEILVD